MAPATPRKKASTNRPKLSRTKRESRKAAASIGRELTAPPMRKLLMEVEVKVSMAQG
jgi:hypothetical protein